jgi:hypothetical protein
MFRPRLTFAEARSSSEDDEVRPLQPAEQRVEVHEAGADGAEPAA